MGPTAENIHEFKTSILRQLLLQFWFKDPAVECANIWLDLIIMFDNRTSCFVLFLLDLDDMLRFNWLNRNNILLWYYLYDNGPQPV